VDKKVNARGGEGRIWRGRRFTKGDYSTGDWGDGFWGSLGFAGRRVSSGVGGLVQGHRFAGGFGHGGQDIHMISWS
jgi:hypothetical protein